MMSTVFKNENAQSLNHLFLQVTNNFPQVRSSVFMRSPQEQFQPKLKTKDLN